MKLFEALANTQERREIRNSIRALCDKFDDGYWAEKDRLHEFPHEFSEAVAAGGWLGIAMPRQFGGAGLGVTEAAIMIQEVGRSAGAFAACSTIHINIFGLHSIVKHGTDRQRAEWLPSIISGQSRACFGVSEADAGLDTSKISTKAERSGDVYVVSGQKIWTSTAQQADKIVLLARTMPLDQCVRPTDGLTLFYEPTSIALRSRSTKSRKWAGTPSIPIRSSSTILSYLSSGASARKEKAFIASSTA